MAGLFRSRRCAARRNSRLSSSVECAAAQVGEAPCLQQHRSAGVRRALWADAQRVQCVDNSQARDRDRMASRRSSSLLALEIATSRRAAKGTGRRSSEFERLCGALGEIGEGGVPVEGDPVWRALPTVSAGRICCALPCRAESSREAQRPVVSSGHGNSSGWTCAMSRQAGWALALLPSRSRVSGRASLGRSR